MSSKVPDQWFLIRTKPGKERWVRDQLTPRLSEVFLPMLKARMPRWGRLAMSVAPLFPGYLFARLDLQTSYFEVKYLAGVSGLVSAGPDPIVVPDAIVTEIRARGVNDIVEIHEVPFDSGQPVRVVEGPFRGFEAIASTCSSESISATRSLTSSTPFPSYCPTPAPSARRPSSLSIFA